MGSDPLFTFYVNRSLVTALLVASLAAAGCRTQPAEAPGLSEDALFTDTAHQFLEDMYRRQPTEVVALPRSDELSDAMQVGGAVVLAALVAGGPARPYAAQHDAGDRVRQPGPPRRCGQPAGHQPQQPAQRRTRSHAEGEVEPRRQHVPRGVAGRLLDRDVHRSDLHPVEAIGGRDEVSDRWPLGGRAHGLQRASVELSRGDA